MFKNIAQAEAVCGPLSKPSKMPCHGYSIPAQRCKVGARMRNVKGSICSVCYALKGRYVFPSVRAALERRYESLFSDNWIDAIVYLIRRQEKSGFFRWHDSGDLQGGWHLEKIVAVAERLPQIKFWLPTREYAIVSEYLAVHKTFPPNLTVRLSALMLDGKTPDSIAKRLGLTVSGASATDWNCPASQQGNKCLDCRLCWDKTVFSVNYRKH